MHRVFYRMTEHEAFIYLHNSCMDRVRGLGIFATWPKPGIITAIRIENYICIIL